jgi:membrane-associated protease RseP (regulator of RpoE activity)
MITLRKLPPSAKQILAAVLTGSIFVALLFCLVKDTQGTVATLTNIALVLIILTIVVSVHEFSHLLTARALKIEVEEFGLGLPPRLLGRTAFGIRWSVNAVPIGAFVALKGEKTDNGQGSFYSAPAWKKVLILVIGPISNLVLAFVLLVGMGAYYSATQNLNFGIGQDFQFASLVLSDVISQTIAAIAGFVPQAAVNPMSMPVVGLPGMVVIAGKMTTLGWEMIVVYIAVISFSMGIVNLLPISVLDGGQAVAVIIKGVTGRFYPARLGRHAKVVQTAALVLVIILIQGIDLIRTVSGHFPGFGK